MKKIETTNSNTPVRIHNDLANGRGNFTACMLDILFYILSDFKKGERFYLIKHDDISALTGREWNYNQFKESTEELGSRMFEIETDKTYLQLWLFSSVEYIKGTGTFEIEISQKALPYLEDLKKNFTSLQLKSILLCSSKFAKRFYMLGCRWRGTSKVPQMTIDELKIMLGLKDPKGKQNDKYPKFSDFRKSVLDIAMSQINEFSDIQMSYTLTKRGRKFYWIDIYVNYQAVKQLGIDFEKPIEIQRLTQKIMFFGFTESQAVAIAKVGEPTFEENRLKFLSKIKKGEATQAGLVPYIITVYQSKGVLVKAVSSQIQRAKNPDLEDLINDAKS